MHSYFEEQVGVNQVEEEKAFSAESLVMCKGTDVQEIIAF